MPNVSIPKDKPSVPTYFFQQSVEAASTDCWKKYIGTEGLAFGIDTFGKSAPYKEIYKYFGLTVQNISQKAKKLIKS